MVKRALAIKTTKIDWKQLITLALNKQGWGKIYTIQAYSDVTVSVVIESMNFKRNCAEFELTCNAKGIEDTWYNKASVQYQLDNFDIVDFERLIERRIQSLVAYCIKERARRIGGLELRHLYTPCWSIDEDMILTSKYKKDWELSEKLSDNLICQIQNEIKEQLQSDMNEDYIVKLDEFIENYDDKESALKSFLTKLEAAYDKRNK